MPPATVVGDSPAKGSGTSGNSAPDPATNDQNLAANNNTNNNNNNNARPTSETGFSREDRNHIATLVFNSASPSAEQKLALTNFFSKICVLKFADLEYQDGQDLLAGADLPKTSPIRGTFKGRLKNFLDYGSEPGVTFSTATTMADIMKTVRDRKQEAHAAALAGVAASDSNSKEYSSLKSTAPVLKAFSGHEEDFWEWFDGVYIGFGEVGMSDSLTDKDFHLTDPKLSKAGFFSIEKALKQGDAKALPDEVREANGGREVAYDLYQWVKKHFDTPATRSHHTLYAFKKLNNIRLDHQTTSTEFLAEWKAILGPLKRNNSPFADNRDLLYCFLLQAIVSDAFSDVMRYMYKHPTAPIKEYLDLIREYNTNHKIHGGLAPTNNEGERILNLRRAESAVVQFNKNKNTEHVFDTDAPPSGRYPKWHIPKFPKGWKNILNTTLWKRLENWRTSAHGTNISPRELDRRFAVREGKTYTPKKQMRRSRNTAGEEVMVEFQPAKRMKIESAFPKLRTLDNGKVVSQHQTITEIPIS